MITSADALGLPLRSNPLLLEGAQLPISSPIAKALDLRDGQIVQASLRLSGGQPELVLKGRIIQAPPQMIAQLNPTLWLKVVQNAQGGWSLQTTPAPSQASAAQGTAMVSSTTAAAPTAPLQVSASPPPSVYSKMANLLFRPPGTSELAQVFRPGNLDALIKTLARPDLQAQWRNIQLSMAQIRPESISSALANALGAEVWLARGLNPAPTDPRQFIRRLIQAMQSPEKGTLMGASASQADVTVGGDMDSNNARDVAPSSISFSQLHQAVEELESAQVQAVQAQSQGEVLFRMTLPFVDADPVELEFRRESRSPDQLPLFIVNVHSRIDKLGDVWLKTQIEGSQQIDLTMWAENTQVIAIARQRQTELREQLRVAGLNMRSLNIIEGARPASPSDFTPTGRGLVVDMSA